MTIWDELKTRTVDGIEGLITVIVQDKDSSEVLMLAYANREALEKTAETGLAHYYSTSRKKLWLKGESSGNTQKVSEILVDCDGDAVIYKAEQKGGACHRGYRTCFYRKITEEGLETVGEKLFEPDEVYKKK
ncbi:MAG: phosphoribosyl-AMP cyclohydrolase [Candidatus Altiarchaeales archaeon]|nr:phosphoribosyl-AMP cyclohydrolase [Candidatus Altiarchaeales archaeon]MBD3416498.1 phosphoribosyl-AMP cyclohydrolase [Candidatus Altiarchaeales archaeon]